MTSEVESTLKDIQRCDWGTEKQEWLQVQNLAEAFPAQADQIYRRVFSSFYGFVETRLRAARILLQSDRDFVLNTCVNLVSSTDPNDRDSALQMLKEIDLKAVKEIALPLMNDEFPNIAFDAIEFLGKDYPHIANLALEKLAINPEEWVRNKAKNLLES